MTVDGYGPYQIARKLTEEKVEKPSYHQYLKGRGNYATQCDTSTPYKWGGATIVRILERPEYMGDTVNFRTYKKNYKDKIRLKNNSEDIRVFKDTHEAIVDRKTWYIVQELRKTIRRTDASGEPNPLTGKLFCADCGSKMHYRRESEIAGRNWKGLLDGTVKKQSATFSCAGYMSKRSYYPGDRCSAHTIMEKVVKQVILETIQYACKSVQMDEAAFMEAVHSASAIREKTEEKQSRRALKKQEKRFAELDALLKKVYEDNALGKLSDRRYEMLSSEYETEQDALAASIQEIKGQLEQYEEDTDRSGEFLSLVHKYTEITELTPAIINEFVEKVLVHKAEMVDGERVMELEVYLNFIGKVEIPAVELSEEERAELEEKKIKRARAAEYQRKRRAKVLPEIRAIRERAKEAEKEKKLADAVENSQKLLEGDDSRQIASMVNGENKIIVEGSVFPTEEEVRLKYAN
jgi:hypothetical protein